MEQIGYNLLFRWFVGLAMDVPVWDATIFSKNRDRLLDGDVSQRLLAAIMAQPRVNSLMSDDHFSVDGTFIQAWASHKSFQPKSGTGEMILRHLPILPRLATVEHHGSGHPAEAQGTGEGGRLPMPVRDSGTTTLTAAGPSAQRAILVEAPVSSTKTRRSGSRSGRAANHGHEARTKICRQRLVHTCWPPAQQVG